MRILVIKLSSLGDLFHALPAVHNLKTALNASIDWVTQPEYVELVKCFTPVERVIAFPRRSFFRDNGAFLRELRAERYDYIVDFQGLLKSALVARLARGGLRIGPSFSREGASLFYASVAGKLNKNRHAVEENLDIVRHLYLDVLDPPQFPVVFPVQPLREKRPRIAVLPVSRWRTKTWSAAKFSVAARALRDRLDASIFLLGGKADEAVCAEMAAQIGEPVINLAGRLTLVETGGILQQMDLLIANDSGPVHMAAAVGTPTLVVFGPTHPVRTGPYGRDHRILTARLPCQPCFSRTCRYETVRCLDSVAADEVVNMAVEMLGAGTAAERPPERTAAQGREPAQPASAGFRWKALFVSAVVGGLSALFLLRGC